MPGRQQQSCSCSRRYYIALKCSCPSANVRQSGYTHSPALYSAPVWTLAFVHQHFAVILLCTAQSKFHAIQPNIFPRPVQMIDSFVGATLPPGCEAGLSPPCVVHLLESQMVSFGHHDNQTTDDVVDRWLLPLLLHFFAARRHLSSR